MDCHVVSRLLLHRIPENLVNCVARTPLRVRHHHLQCDEDHILAGSSGCASDLEAGQLADDLNRPVDSASPCRRAPRAGAGEVDHQGAAGDTGQPAGHPGVDDSGRQPRRTQRLGDAEQFAVEDVDGRFRRDVARASHRCRRPTPPGRLRRSRPCSARCGSRPRRRTPRPRRRRRSPPRSSSSVTNGPLWSSSSPCAVRSSTTTTSARPTNSPGCSMNANRISGHRQRRSHCQRDWSGRHGGPHCSALPSVTSHGLRLTRRSRDTSVSPCRRAPWTGPRRPARRHC